MKTCIDVFPMLQKMNEQFDYFTKRNKGDVFTDILEELYEPLNNDEETGEFLNQRVLAEKKHATEYVVTNIDSRWQLLNILITLMPADLYHYFLSNNDFRRQILTKGAFVKMVNNQYVSYSYENYTFPSTGGDKSKVDDKDFYCLGRAEDPDFEDGATVLRWPGLGMVLPKRYNIFIRINPDLNFPNFIVENKKKNKTVSFHEENWGVSLSQSEKNMVSYSVEGQDREKARSFHSLFSHDKEKDGLPNFFNIYFYIEKNKFFGEEYELTMEFPIGNFRQDILMKIGPEGEAPVVFTCTC